MNLAAFPTGTAFLPALATAWLAAPGDPTAGLIILPSRRAARALAGAFLTANAGRPLLLPRIIAPGALDEAALTLHSALSIPPAIPQKRRQAILTQLILKTNGQNGAPTRFHAAWSLATDLAALIDEAATAEIPLLPALQNLVPANLAAHWQTTLTFLEIATTQWPKILSEMGLLDPATRQAKLLDAQAAHWATNPPPTKTWAVTANASPALARLARTIATLPTGAVILPNYDWHINNIAWDTLDDTHAQAGIARLLGALGARREDIRPWPAPPNTVPEGRCQILSQTLLPAAALTQWQSSPPHPPTNLHRLTPPDESTEALAIAMALRDALETPGRGAAPTNFATAALITPDRLTARRVTAALERFGILADDSAGEPLTDTPPAVFLRLLANAAATQFAPIPLLSLLKHPLTAAGDPPEITRRNARTLERLTLRGPRPPPGFDGLRYKLERLPRRDAGIESFLTRLESSLKPLTSLPIAIPPAEALTALLQTAESLCATPESPGAARLWAADAGAALAEHIAELLEALESLPGIQTADLPLLLDSLLQGPAVRKPRTRDAHPRIAIWGVQESALQTVDTAILAGLTEGTWPATPEPGPWLSRPMRHAAGLPSLERQIGQSAHDFFALATTCPTVILSAPTRKNRAPAVPARWLTRLEAYLAATTQTLTQHQAASWAHQLDTPAARTLHPKPAPKPPASARPTTLSISDIATLIADPYAIYARKILKIRELDQIDQESDPSQFGNIVHAGLAKFFAETPNFHAPAAPAQLTAALENAMREQRPRAALQHWWEARLQRIATWIIASERARRLINGDPIHIALEHEATMPVGQNFTLNGRADRIESRTDGTIFIMDYKTGIPPTEAAIKAGTAPQLPLEAVMAEAAAFGEAFCNPVTELAFWKLSGRHEPGEEKSLFAKNPQDLRDAIEAAAENLPALFEKFARESTPYLAKPHPSRSTYADPYAGISRRNEWGGEQDNDDSD